ncbi:MAG: YHS domain-containing protein [Alphaproteobacteria bacterium]|nr:MAG: YHS domain-containing protein [Alphaproteobacteria bacterium]
MMRTAAFGIPRMPGSRGSIRWGAWALLCGLVWFVTAAAVAGDVAGAGTLPPGDVSPDAHHRIYTSGGGWFAKGFAVGGYDPVAYFTEHRPVKGAPGISLEYLGATWRFASVENRERFRQDPQKYMPQYGGFCAWAAADGKAAPGNPRYWRIVDGRLYLNYDRATQKKWLADPAGFIARADRHWRSPEGLH